MTLQTRIVKALSDTNGLNQAGLARACGISRASVNAWVRGSTESIDGKYLTTAAAYLNVNPHWLATGQGPAKTFGDKSGDKQAERPVDAVQNISGGHGVPLISWVQAGSWSDVSDPFQVGDAEDWLPCPVRHGPRTYCVRVRGDSMFNPAGRPSYADGDIVFVDPDRDAQNGDRVIVRLDDQQEATFKQLLVEDGRKILKALNPEWSPKYLEINERATITGVVIGKWVPE